MKRKKFLCLIRYMFPLSSVVFYLPRNVSIEGQTKLHFELKRGFTRQQRNDGQRLFGQ